MDDSTHPYRMIKVIKRIATANSKIPVADSVTEEDLRRICQYASELYNALDDLLVTGEFAGWLVGKEVPWAAVKEIDVALRVLGADWVYEGDGIPTKDFTSEEDTVK